MNQLSEILKQTRAKLKYNKSQMARRLGVSSQLYGQYETGTKKPGGTFFIRWRKEFGTDLAELVETSVSHGKNQRLDETDTGDIYKEKYIALLEKENERKSDIIQANLTELLIGHRISHAHLKTLLQVTVTETAVMQGKDPEKALDDANRVVAETFAASQRKGTGGGM